MIDLCNNSDKNILFPQLLDISAISAIIVVCLVVIFLVILTAIRKMSAVNFITVVSACAPVPGALALISAPFCDNALDVLTRSEKEIASYFLFAGVATLYVCALFIIRTMKSR